jgi:hypothetical protein
MAKTSKERDVPPKSSYPLTLKGELKEPLSRWKWLLKIVPILPILIVPHAFVLIFLWIAAAFVTVIAFFSILFTGQYPRPLFNFTVGVLRWTWRVSFYSGGALATDKYPPFSLRKRDYPADLEVEYSEDMTRWKPLVKWFFAVPHYLCLCGLTSVSFKPIAFIGLLPAMILITGVLLLFTGKYRQDIWKLVMGVNRWSFRVAAYVLLLTDEYPPFSLSE